MRGPIHVINPVWGNAYVERFLKLALPFQLSRANFGGLENHREWAYFIYTSDEDAPLLRDHKLIRALATMVDVHVVTIGSRQGWGGISHKIQNAAYIDGLRRGRDCGAGVVLALPDAIIADGSVQALDEWWREVRRCVLTVPFRLDVNGLIRELAAGGHLAASTTDGISPADLGRIAMRTLHSWTRLLSLGAMTRNNARNTAGIFHSPEPTSLISASWMYHPTLIDSSALCANFENYFEYSNDLAMPHVLTIRPDEMLVPEGVGHFCWVEFSDHTMSLPPDSEPIADDGEIAKFLAAFYRRYILSRCPRTDLALALFREKSVFSAVPPSAATEVGLRRVEAIITAALREIEGT